MWRFEGVPKFFPDYSFTYNPVLQYRLYSTNILGALYKYNLRSDMF